MSGRRRRAVSGVIYLLHFSQPYRHARHYIGWTEDLERRMTEHGTGEGSALLRAVRAAGITWELVRTWHGDRYLERSLKQAHGAAMHCPIYHPGYLQAARARMWRRRHPSEGSAPCSSV